VAVTKEITRLEKSNVKLSITIPKDEVRSQYQDMLKDYTKKLQLPGFRKGKVPQEVLERKFGKSLKSEALVHIIEWAVTEVLKDENLPKEDLPLPYSTPKVQEEPALDFEQDMAFSVVYDVFPQVSLGQWKGLEFEFLYAELTDEDIGRELEEVRERNAIVLDRDDGAEARAGDVVTVNYCEIGEEGQILPNSEREDFVFTLGSGYNIYKFDDEISGMQKGGTKDFTKTFPADFEYPALAGQTKKIRLTLTALKEKKLPDLDDDLAQDVDEKFNTLDDLKNSVRERLNKNLEHRLREIKINSLMEKLMENTPAVIPESMIRMEVDGRLRNLARRLNTDADTVLKMMTASEDSADNMVEKWRSAAERDLHSRLIVETLMKERNIELSDEAMEKELETMAADTGITVEELKKYYQENSGEESLKEEVKERKLFDMLLAENTAKPGKRENYLDLMKDSR
jgi:trigger factor